MSTELMTPKGDATPARAQIIADLNLSDNDNALAGLMGRIAPSRHTLIAEKPEHRVILYMKMAGKTVSEIARETGYSLQHTSLIIAQPWFKKAFAQIAHSIGADPIRKYLETEALPAVQRVIDLANRAESEQVRLAANRELLDRFLGKPVARIESKNQTDLTIVQTQASEVDRELATLTEQLKSYGVGAS